VTHKCHVENSSSTICHWQYPAAKVSKAKPLWRAFQRNLVARVNVVAKNQSGHWGEHSQFTIKWGKSNGHMTHKCHVENSTSTICHWQYTTAKVSKAKPLWRAFRTNLVASVNVVAKNQSGHWGEHNKFTKKNEENNGHVTHKCHVDNSTSTICHWQYPAAKVSCTPSMTMQAAYEPCIHAASG
jgi:hypothetical protein